MRLDKLDILFEHLDNESFDFDVIAKKAVQEYMDTDETERTEKLKQLLNQCFNYGEECLHLFKYKFIKKFPDYKSFVIKYVKSLLGENLNSNYEMLIVFLEKNYPGYYFDELENSAYYMDGKKARKIDLNVLVSDLFKEDLKVSIKNMDAFFRSPNKVAQYNKVRDFFEGLPVFDPAGTDYVAKLFMVWKVREMPVENWKSFLMKHFLNWFCRATAHVLGKATARIMNKEALIFISPSSGGKTSFLTNQLIHKTLFKLTDLHFDFQNISERENHSLCHNMFIFLDEFEAFGLNQSNVQKKTINLFKRFTGNTQHNYKVNGKSITAPRRGNFIMTMNPKPFIKDDTLLTRFIPVDLMNDKFNKIKFDDWTEHDCLGFWSQIYHFFNEYEAGNYEIAMSAVDSGIFGRVNMRYKTNTGPYAELMNYVLPGKNATDLKMTVSQLLNFVYERTHNKEFLKLNAWGVGSFLRENGFKQVTDRHSASGRKAWLIKII